MRKSSFNYPILILGLFIIILIVFTMNSKKEGFTGPTYVVDESGGNVCPKGKRKVGVNNSPIDENNYFEGMECPTGYALSYLTYGNEPLSLKCTKLYPMCDEGYKYNKNVKDGKYCQNITNSNDRIAPKGGAVCPLPTNDEVRIIMNYWCIIGSKKIKPKCKSGFTYDTNISKCYKCV